MILRIFDHTGVEIGRTGVALIDEILVAVSAGIWDASRASLALRLTEKVRQ